MKKIPLKELAEIGCAAALNKIIGAYAMAVSPNSSAWECEREAREAFTMKILEAVDCLDAIQRDEEREKFNKFMAECGEDLRKEAFALWKAAREDLRKEMKEATDYLWDFDRKKP